MEAMFQVQQKVKRELGLAKIQAVRNPNYKANGTKSYVHLLNKYRFQPTLPGPYTFVKRIHQRGLAHPDFHTPVGGRVHLERCLVKRHHERGHDDHAGHYRSRNNQHGSHHAGPRGSGSGPDGPPAEHGKTAVSGTAPGASEPPSTGAPAGQSGTETGEVTAEDQQNDSMYICPVQIGTPPQTLNLDFDTGSSDLWVFSTELPENLRQNHNVYDQSQSSTAETATGLTWKIQYGDGSTASGDVCTDVVNVGGVTVQNQAVEKAKQLSSQFSQGTGDGLLGLAFSSINTVTPTQQNTPVANMIANGTLPEGSQLFTSAFYSDRDQGAQSFYTFGYIDQTTLNGQEISWTPVDSSQGFWMFPSASYSINGTTTEQPGNTAICDTGTTLCLISDAACKALYAQIPGATYNSEQQGYVFPTSVTADQLPDFAVAVGDKLFTIQKEDLAFTTADGNNWFGGVQSRGDNPFDILGDCFLKSTYVIWDQGNTRIGHVPKIQQTQNLNPSAASEGQ